MLGDLSKNVWGVAVGPNGEVWVEKYRIAGHGGQGVDPGDPRIRDERWHRLGDPESYRGPGEGGWGREAPDCRGSSGPDGSRWLIETWGWLDGLADDVPAQSVVVRVAADGTLQGYSRNDLGVSDDIGQGQQFLTGEYFAYADDGTVWTTFGLAWNDGATPRIRFAPDGSVAATLAFPLYSRSAKPHHPAPGRTHLTV